MKKNKALFLDRDGVINVEKNYVHKIEAFEFVEGIFELTKYFQDMGYLLIVITNQAGIAKGFYSEKDLSILTIWMIEEFNKRDITISGVYYCPFHPEGLGEYKKQSNCRKPEPGMILQAAQDFKIDLSESLLIGDKESDIEAGFRAGIKNNFLFNNFSSRTDSIFKITHLKDLIKVVSRSPT
ncbi:D-glycero-alpha-D-manno-heptose-1,7-bisphosphate 7-phosphatase [Paenibacillus eucommiae]|uniref:D,D-heptose 1,7-bisphosphate phosphatase n=1 Tax=Paenibacillus eucommiae TaxID=1355755 RepID=A0ABS4IUA2_9BACL|nr:HAD family hydrolase [Paenibacillus eucommiae]MBP1991144.1 D-glycero-D-manno-heptose 1,7-bisphosphate phosphatase [Paenibacillus eucommiae]